MKKRDARRTAKELWDKFSCYKLRLADGTTCVVSREWWEQFLSDLLTVKKA